jgi:hypothetical protein
MMPSVGAKLGKSSTLHEKTEQRVAKAEALAVLDDAMLCAAGSTLFRTTSEPTSVTSRPGPSPTQPCGPLRRSVVLERLRGIGEPVRAPF